jgi:stearoyl-CoA desaturase (delta-9 desaturase)
MALTRVARAPDERVGWGILPFVLLHLGCLAGIWIHPTWQTATLGVGLYAVRMFGITGGYHRYFAHRTYKTSRAFQFILAFIGGASAQKGVLWWAGHHRSHHQNSDTPADLHSPARRGFWWSHMLWFLVTKYDATPVERIADMHKYPELRFLNKYHWVPSAILGAAVLALAGWGGFVWGFLVSTVVLYHGTFTINSLSHVFGKQRYRTTDTSRNNWVLAIVTLGEGWHNNHHYFQSSANNGFFWWEVDITYYVLWALAKLGVVWDLKLPPESVLHKNRVEDGDSIPALAPRGGPLAA